MMCLSACEGRCPPCNHITYDYVFISTMKSWQTTTQSELRLQYRTSHLNTEMILLVSCEPDMDTSCKISANSCSMSTGVTRLLSTDVTQHMLHVSCLQILRASCLPMLHNISCVPMLHNISCLPMLHVPVAVWYLAVPCEGT